MIDELAWFSLAVYGAVRAIQSWREARLDFLALGDNANGKRLVAVAEQEHAALGVLMYFLWMCAGTVGLLNELGVLSDYMRLEINPLLTVGILLVLVVRQDRDNAHRRRYMGHSSGGPEGRQG